MPKAMFNSKNGTEWPLFMGKFDLIFVS